MQGFDCRVVYNASARYNLHPATLSPYQPGVVPLSASATIDTKHSRRKKLREMSLDQRSVCQLASSASYHDNSAFSYAEKSDYLQGPGNGLKAAAVLPRPMEVQAKVEWSVDRLCKGGILQGSALLPLHVAPRSARPSPPWQHGSLAPLSPHPAMQRSRPALPLATLDREPRSISAVPRRGTKPCRFHRPVWANHRGAEDAPRRVAPLRAQVDQKTQQGLRQPAAPTGPATRLVGRPRVRAQHASS